MDYLSEAADLLRKARDDNEERVQDAADMVALRRPVQAAEILREVNDRRMEIADGFIRLAAIKAGVPDPEELT